MKISIRTGFWDKERKQLTSTIQQILIVSTFMTAANTIMSPGKIMQTLNATWLIMNLIMLASATKAMKKKE